MTNATKMLMLSGDRNRDGYDRPEAARRGSRGTLTWDNTHGAESAYRGGYGGRMGYGDMNYGDMTYGGMDRGGMNYPRSEMDEPESRRRRDSRGRFRSEMDGGAEMRRTDMPYPMYPPPVYEEYGGMNQIGFAAHDGSERNNLHMIRGGAGYSEHLDKQTAEKWMESLHNEDGTKGPHWTMEQVKQVMSQKNWQEDPVRAWVVMNMMYSDYCAAAKKVNANTVDFYVNMAKAFLDDKDAGAEDKLAAYYHYIVK